MAVTADVWEEAHDYHRHQQRLHALLAHGWGIVTGLEVIASDPPDSSVYILPGVAVDPGGHTIVLTHPVAYDLGRSADGPLYLLLSHGESRPRRDESRGAGEDVFYVHSEFGIAAEASLPSRPHIELARVRRLDRESPVTDARDSAHPAAGEIDLRFRREIGATSRDTIRVAVSYAGGVADGAHGRGAGNLARDLSRSGAWRVWVDDDVPLGPDLREYTLVYLVAERAFQFGRDEMNALYEYLQGGGTLFVESCRHRSGDDAPAEAPFLDLVASFGLKLEEVAPGHSLLAEPCLFGAPPPGFETEGAPRVLVGDGVILSSHDYGCLWCARRRDRTPSREEIRAAMEWGANILAYALERSRKSKSP